MRKSVVNNTRQQIIDYSANCLRSRGFDGFSYLDISRELGIKKASVHHHFPKKEDLGIALCEWTKDWMIQGLDHFDQRGNSSWDKLERYLKAALKHSESDNHLCPLAAFYNDLSKLPEAILVEIKKLDALELNWVKRVIQQGQSDDEFNSDDDAEAMASLFIYSCKGALHHARLHGSQHYFETMQQVERLLKR